MYQKMCLYPVWIRLLQQDQQRRVQSAFDDEQWQEAIWQYADIAELDAVTLNKLVRQVVVHEAIDEDATRKISVESHFNMKQQHMQE